jgi:hypothetical protein
MNRREIEKALSMTRQGLIDELEALAKESILRFPEVSAILLAVCGALTDEVEMEMLEYLLPYVQTKTSEDFDPSDGAALENWLGESGAPFFGQN